MALSDLMLDTFACETAVLRAMGSGGNGVAGGLQPAGLHADAATVIAHDAGLHAEMTARTLLGGMLSGDAQRTALAGLRRILKVPPVNTIAARRRIADAITSRLDYPYL
jgi:hypothetical protein